MSLDALPTLRGAARGENDRPATGARTLLVLGRYRLQQRLGAGAFGTVWMARDERLDRDVAVKIVPRERVAGGRLQREAHAAARLAHPAIVTLYEAAIDDDSAYLVSELVRGATFDRLLGAGRLSDRKVIAIALALCDALAHAHAQGVVHRDVKPSNVLIPERPASPAYPVKLTDFGVARVLGGDSLTHTGDVVGTADYMAPEQAEGLPAGPAADLYALALVTYEGLTGVNPIRTGTAAMRARRLGAHLPPLRRQRRDLPLELARAIDLALRPRPRERGSIEDLREALSLSLDQVREAPRIVAAGQPDPIRPAARDTSEAWPTVGPWPARVLAAATAAAVAAWCSASLSPSWILAPAGVALLAGTLVLALPRAGWLALSLALVVGAIAHHRPGGGLVILLVALLPVALLPRKGVTWPLAAVAPALGVIGLAGAWPALAALAAPTAWRRAALGSVGWVWLALAGPLAGAGLYTALPSGAPAPRAWTASLHETLHQVLLPVIHTGALAGAPVWALAALALPGLAKRRSHVLAVVLVTVWAAAALVLAEAAIAVVHGPGGSTAPRNAVVGAVASAAVALSPRLLAGMRARAHAASPARELP